MRILVTVNINPKTKGAYDIQAAYRDIDSVGWSKKSLEKKNVKVGDIVYLFLCEPIRKIKYKCIITNTNADPKTIPDDSKYYLTDRDESDSTDSCYVFKKIEEIDDNRLDFEHLKKVMGWSLKATSFRGAYNDEGKCKRLFDYIDSIVNDNL
ncbi:hypothetical protein DVW02_09105 [Clostridium botulinum]|nr:hypothetical protein [Clostridium botulinum]